MPTIIEHDIQRDGGMSSALVAIIAILAVLLVVAAALYVLQIYPFSSQAAADPATPPAVNVNVNGSLPAADTTAQTY